LTNAYPVLKFSKGKNAVLKLKYAETLYKYDNTKGHRDIIEDRKMVGLEDMVISGGGNHEYSPLWYRTFRYVELTIETKSEELYLEDFYGVFTGFPFDLKASIESDNPFLRQLFDVGWR